jgi:hypothetical protein
MVEKVAKITKVVKNTIRLGRMDRLVREIQQTDGAIQRYVQPIIDAVREHVGAIRAEQARKMQALREACMDEGIPPDFAGIQVDLEKGEVYYNLREEEDEKKPEAPWPGKDVEENKAPPKKVAQKKAATRKRSSLK